MRGCGMYWDKWERDKCVDTVAVRVRQLTIRHALRVRNPVVLLWCDELFSAVLPCCLAKAVAPARQQFPEAASA